MSEFSSSISETFFLGSIIHNWFNREFSFRNFEILPLEIFSAISTGFPEFIISAFIIIIGGLNIVVITLVFFAYMYKTIDSLKTSAMGSGGQGGN